ncbi:MAG: tripartite tricarboxylate transporter substrate binding protein [Betaproteobacteria bacterium]
MKISFNQRAMLLTASLLWSWCPCSLNAQTWPLKPIVLVVTYPPGGTADIMARTLASPLGQVLGTTVVVENKPGASGQIAASFVAKSSPDGYTIMLDASSFSVNPSLYPNLPYQPEKDFKTLGILALYPNVLLVNPSFPVRAVKELVSLAKAKPNSISFASSGNGSAQHLAGVLFANKTKIEMQHVPYKGAGIALNDVMGGQIPVFFGSVGSTIQYIESKKLLALAVTSGKRVPSLPDVPTMSEAGIPSYEIYEWNALFAPSATPKDLLQKLTLAIAKVTQREDFKERVSKLGGEVFQGDSEVAERFIKQQMLQWSLLAKDKLISID